MYILLLLFSLFGTSLKFNIQLLKPFVGQNIEVLGIQRNCFIEGSTNKRTFQVFAIKLIYGYICMRTHTTTRITITLRGVHPFIYSLLELLFLFNPPTTRALRHLSGKHFSKWQIETCTQCCKELSQWVVQTKNRKRRVRESLLKKC